LDPGNIAGDLGAGVQGKYSLFWTLILATLLGYYYQTLASKLGVCTQRNIAKLCAQQFTAKSKYTLWIMIEIAILASNMQVVISTATAFQMLFNLPAYICVIMTILDALVFLLIHYYGAKKIEFFFLGLMAIMTIMFVSNMAVSKPDVKQIALGSVIPKIPPGAFEACLGLIGSVVMPANLYL
jgi:NRAMP (natural resistance-associated macrophage protein)-like metal ion transporter